MWRRFRWATVWLPLLFVLVLEIVEDFLIEPQFGRWGAHLFIIVAVGVGAIVLSIVVFKTVEAAEQRLRRQNRDLAAINEISRVVSGSLDLDALLVQSLDRLLEVVEVEAGEIFLLDDEGAQLIQRVHRGIYPAAFQEITRFAVGDGFPGIVAATGEPMVVTDLTTDSRFRRRAVVAQGIRVMACVPLRAKDRVVGVLNVADRNKSFSPEELNLLNAIGNQIGLAVENAKLFARVSETLGYLDAVIKSSGDAVITTDLDGDIRSWNPGAEYIYGWTADEAISRRIPMVPEDLRDEAMKILKQAGSGETVFNFETQRLHKSGHRISVVVTVSPVRDAEGATIGLVGTSKDVSERIRLQAEISQQKQSMAVMEERERIAREMHDGLGQVLGYVNTKVQAVRRFLAVGKTEEAQAHLLQLEEAAREVYADVRETIFGLRSTVARDASFVETLQRYVQVYEQQNNLRVGVFVTDRNELDAILPAVEVQVIRIIQEALTNIRKHAHAQQVCVRIGVGSGSMQLTVEDDGDGFDPARNHRGDRPRFGLQTMRERAEGVGGRLEVKSAVGHGTCIGLTLPLDRHKESP